MKFIRKDFPFLPTFLPFFSNFDPHKVRYHDRVNLWGGGAKEGITEQIKQDTTLSPVV